ncbi:unnamed protein product [Rotaria magnacalcarata]
MYLSYYLPVAIDTVDIARFFRKQRFPDLLIIVDLYRIKLHNLSQPKSTRTLLVRAQHALCAWYACRHMYRLVIQQWSKKTKTCLNILNGFKFI